MWLVWHGLGGKGNLTGERRPRTFRQAGRVSLDSVVLDTAARSTLSGKPVGSLWAKLRLSSDLAIIATASKRPVVREKWPKDSVLRKRYLGRCIGGQAKSLISIQGPWLFIQGCWPGRRANQLLKHGCPGPWSVGQGPRYVRTPYLKSHDLL
jgi:hypothetical protein